MAEPRSDLVRSLSLLDITMIGIAGMIGGAIFILALDSKIRFTTIFDTNGKTVQSVHCKGLTSMLSKAESKKSTNEILKSHEVHEELLSKYGKEIYSIGVYEKIIRIIIPLDKENILYVTTYIDVDPFSAITKLTKLIQK